MNRIIISYNKCCQNIFKKQLVLNGRADFANDYRVATISKLYLIVIGIIMQSLKLIGQF